MPSTPDRPVKNRKVAKLLNIDPADLPEHDHPWTRDEVRALRGSRPDWLTDARRRHGARVRQAALDRDAELDRALTRLGYQDPDLGTLHQALFYVDGALMHLMHATGCSEVDADRAAWRRWPRSMAAEEAYNDAHPDDPW